MNTLIPFIISPFIIAILQISSPAFHENNFIPKKYSCKGQNVNPPLVVKNIPASARTLALIVDDPDAKKGVFDHWVVWNIEPTGIIDENTAPGTQGKNSKGENTYTGPCPPSGIHHYHFKVYALDTKLTLSNNADKEQLEKAMKGHIVAQGELIGLYESE